MILIVRARSLVHGVMRTRGKISMQEQEGMTGRKKIANGGKETRNGRANRAE